MFGIATHIKEDLVVMDLIYYLSSSVGICIREECKV